MAKISPLHRVIDAGRWDAELLLDRLLILVHAAFLDAGFVSAEADTDVDDESSVRLPRQVGMTRASPLPVRYAVPQLLLHSPDEDTVTLRLRAYGRNLVFFVCITRTPMFGNPWLDMYWTCLDAVAAAPLLSGGLDDTARALRRDPLLAALWRALTDRLCRRVLADLCAKNGVTLEARFMSLPGDVKAAILARLPVARDLARVECTCTRLRRVVADHDAALWKPRYEKLLVQRQIAEAGSDEETTPEMSWKERYRYMAATGWRPAPPKVSRMVRFGVVGLGRRRILVRMASMSESDTLILGPWMDSWQPILCDDDLPWRMELDDLSWHKDSFDPFRLFDSPEEEETVPRRRRMRAMRRDGCSRGHAMVLGGHTKQRQGAGAVHSPSSRFRWKHR